MNNLREATVFFLALNLCVFECALYAIFGRPKQKTIGLALLGSAAAGIVVLVLCTTRLSPLLFGRQLIEVDLISLLLYPPTILGLLLVVVMASVAWSMGYATRWRRIASLVFMLGLALMVIVIISRIEVGSAFPVLAASGIGITAANALTSQPRWVFTLPVISVAALGFALVVSNQPVPIPDPQLAGDLPEGFQLDLYAQLTELPTSVVADPDGGLYVATTTGNVIKLLDTNRDGTADQETQFATSLGQPLGIVWYQNRVFISTNTYGEKDSGRIVRVTDTTGDGVADEYDDIVTGLPSGYYPLHQNNELAIGPDERLYIGIGSTTDHDPETVPLAASILSVNLDGGDLHVFATGLRNPYGLAFSEDGRLFATDNAPDQLDDALPYVPPDELNLIVEGGDYGFPDYTGSASYTANALPPVLVFTMHTVPAGLVVYSGSEFPAEYHGNLFVALWQEGPDVNGEAPSRGQRIARIALAEASDEQGAVDHDFVTGLQGPIDLDVGPAGELYLADMLARRIYRVTFAP